MRSPQFDILVEVLQARVLEKKVESVNAQIKANDGAYPLYSEAAASLSRDALKLMFVITILTQLRDQKESFVTVTVTPD